MRHALRQHRQGNTQLRNTGKGTRSSETPELEPLVQKMSAEQHNDEGLGFNYGLGLGFRGFGFASSHPPILHCRAGFRVQGSGFRLAQASCRGLCHEQEAIIITLDPSSNPKNNHKKGRILGFKSGRALRASKNSARLVEVGDATWDAQG